MFLEMLCKLQIFFFILVHRIEAKFLHIFVIFRLSFIGIFLREVISDQPDVLQITQWNRDSCLLFPYIIVIWFIINI